MLGSAVVVRGTPTGPAGDDLRFGFDGDIDDLHLRLSVAGPFERIRDECGRGGLLARLRLLLFHLTVGGELRMLLPPAGGGFDEARDRLLSFVAEVNALRGSAELSPPVIERTDVRPNPERDLHAFAASLGDLRVDDDLVVATSRVDTCAKIPEDRMNDLLRARPDIGHVIDTVPGTTRPARGRFRSSSPGGDPTRRVRRAELSLREYHGPVVAPRQVAIHDNVVLPESFRNPVRPRLRSRTLVDWSKQFVRRPDLPPLPMLPGRWFYLDNIMRGHFGHALTEQLSHVWAWPRAKRAHPDLRALVFRWEDHEMADWELRLFEAAGIDRADVTVLDQPTRVETLIAATPAYAIGPYIHPAIEQTYRAVGRSLGSQARAESYPERLFLTRRSAKRACRNRSDVEAHFAEAGFRIVHPEEHDLAEQVAMMRSAPIVAGFAGSGMFHLAFTDPPKQVAVISPETYPANNERQICAFVGHDLTMLRCRSDVVTERFAEASFHSTYRFDFDREGTLLADWLAGLPPGG